MSNINTDKIIQETKEKIGFINFERKEMMMKNKAKKITYVVMGISLLTIGTFSVNAMTDNSIGKAISDFVKVKVDGKDYNANCSKQENGDIVCKLGKESLGTETEIEYTITPEGQEMQGVDIEYSISEDGSSSAVISETKIKDETNK